jgi:hypothetical protein
MMALLIGPIVFSLVALIMSLLTRPQPSDTRFKNLRP